MTTAHEIPADVMAAARAEWLDRKFSTDPPGSIEVIARAILAERQRCVDAVKAEANSWLDMGFQHEYLGAMHAARAIKIQGPTI